MLSLVTAPTDEPVTLDDARLQCRIDYADEDDLLDSLIAAAREWVESSTHRALLTQTWDLKLDAFPCAGEAIVLPKSPLQSVTSVTYYDQAGDLQTWDDALYTVDAPSGAQAGSGSIYPNYREIYPATQDIPNAVIVRFVAGYGTSGASVPASLRQAILMRVLDWWETGRASTVVGNIVTPVPHTLEALIWPYKVF